MAQIPLLPEPDDNPWEYTLCFTGHRPERLPQNEALAALARTLHYYIGYAVQLGFTHFYTGLADGIDYLAAAYLFRLRETNPALHIIGVQPCTDYREFFRIRGYSLMRLDYMLRNADSIHVMPHSWRDKDAFRQRNCYMVDHSSCIIAVCEDGRSGSMQTFRYAQAQGLAYCRIKPYWKAPYPSPDAWFAERSGF